MLTLRRPASSCRPHPAAQPGQALHHQPTRHGLQRGLTRRTRGTRYARTAALRQRRSRPPPLGRTPPREGPRRTAPPALAEAARLLVRAKGEKGIRTGRLGTGRRMVRYGGHRPPVYPSAMVGRARRRRRRTPTRPSARLRPTERVGRLGRVRACAQLGRTQRRREDGLSRGRAPPGGTGRRGRLGQTRDFLRPTRALRRPWTGREPLSPGAAGAAGQRQQTGPER
jgi:hypothetical protein